MSDHKDEWDYQSTWSDHSNPKSISSLKEVPIGSIAWIMTSDPKVFEVFPPLENGSVGGERPVLIVDHHAREGQWRQSVSIFKLNNIGRHDSRRKSIMRQKELFSLQSWADYEGMPGYISSNDTLYNEGKDWHKHSFVELNRLYRVEILSLAAFRDRLPTDVILPMPVYHSIVNAWNNRLGYRYHKKAGSANNVSYFDDHKDNNGLLRCHYAQCTHLYSPMSPCNGGNIFTPYSNLVFKHLFSHNSDVRIGSTVWIRGFNDSSHRLGYPQVPQNIYKKQIASIPGAWSKSLNTHYGWRNGQGALVVERVSSDAQVVRLFTIRYMYQSMFQRLTPRQKSALVLLDESKGISLVDSLPAYLRSKLSQGPVYDMQKHYCDVSVLWEVPIGLLEQYCLRDPVSKRDEDFNLSGEDFNKVLHKWNSTTKKNRKKAHLESAIEDPGLVSTRSQKSAEEGPNDSHIVSEQMSSEPPNETLLDTVQNVADNEPIGW